MNAPLVTPDWCRMMARYNAWQNDGLAALVPSLPEPELTRDRGAFFGSILATLSHVLWADRVWLSRLAGPPADLGGIPGSVRLAPTVAAWIDGRRATDADIANWTGRLTDADLAREVTWTPASGGPARSRPMGFLVSHMFNHQTHHRGQVHAMLTAAGARPQATDLLAMPD